MKKLLSKLPPANVYEKEYKYWPWGKLIDKIKEWVINNASESSYIIDYMCGTGYLLNEIATIRKDLKIEGCSITYEYIEYAKKRYPNIKVFLEDVIDFEPSSQPDIIIATGGLHHLDWNKQKVFINKVSSELASGKYFILGEELISSYNNKKARMLAVLELSNNLIREVVNSNAPESVIEAAVDLLKTDLFERGEYKTSLTVLIDILEANFTIETIEKIWPQNKEHFGDYIIILKRK